MEQSVQVRKYIIRFGIINLMLLVGIAVFFSLIGVESNSGATAAALMGAAMFTVVRFIQDNKRVPNATEKSKLVWYSYLASWLVSIILFGFFMSFSNESVQVIEAIESINILFIVGVVIFISIFYLFALHLSYGSLANKQFEALQKKGKI